MNEKILIVDDEESVRNSLKEYFQLEGFTVEVAENGNRALERIKTSQTDVVILDVQLPDTDGFEICKAMRSIAGQSIDVIMISGINRELVDRVVGLEFGANVYLTKQFKTRELLAQVRALLRRSKTLSVDGSEEGWFIVDDDLRIQFERRVVEEGGEEALLTRLEFDLLEYLVQHAGLPCGRSDLVDAVWGYEAGGEIWVSSTQGEGTTFTFDVPQYLL
jgi:DNA-binding response OmpR family regulator